MLEYKINALTESVKTLSTTLREQFGAMNTRLDTLQMEQRDNATLLRLVVGSGEPGQGRLGLAEKTIETLKRYWWQFAGSVAVVLFLLDLVLKKW